MFLHLRRSLALTTAVIGVPMAFNTSVEAVTYNGAVIFNNDATSGISSSKTYTHRLDIGNSSTAGSTVNGVNLIDSGVSGANYTLAGTTAQTQSANTGVTVGGGTDFMLRDFRYNGVANGGDSSLTLTGLTPGTTYEARVYFRQFSAFNRSHTVRLLNGDEGSAVTFNPDAANQAGYLSFTYTANEATTVIDFIKANPSGSWHHYAFTNEVAAAPAPVVLEGLLLSDNFTTGGPIPSGQNGDINRNLAGRQGGLLAPVSYRAVGNVQIGNTGAGDKTILDGGNVLLLAGGGRAVINENFNGATTQGALEVIFDAAPDVRNGNVNSSDWVAINIGANANEAPGVNANLTHFGLLFRENGGYQAFDGSVAIGSGAFTLNVLEDQFYRDIRILMSDPTDGNPFDGIGQTTIQAFYEGVNFYTFTKGAGGYANNFINFQGLDIGYVDNVRISIVIPEPATAALGLLSLGGLMLRRRRMA